jgi:hypothetical protein
MMVKKKISANIPAANNISRVVLRELDIFDLMVLSHNRSSRVSKRSIKYMQHLHGKVVFYQISSKTTWCAASIVLVLMDILFGWGDIEILPVRTSAGQAAYAVLTVFCAGRQTISIEYMSIGINLNNAMNGKNT